jgi:hypothetical protein
MNAMTDSVPLPRHNANRGAQLSHCSVRCLQRTPLNLKAN